MTATPDPQPYGFTRRPQRPPTWTGVRQYLVECANDTQEEYLLQVARGQGMRLAWVAGDPNPEHDGERRLATLDVWPRLQAELAAVVTAWRGPGAWPAGRVWSEAERRRLIQMAVARWSYLSDRPGRDDRLLDLDDFAADLAAGRLADFGLPALPFAGPLPEPADPAPAHPEETP